MKQIGELTSQATQTPFVTPSIEYSSESKRVIQEIFLLMKANYGHKWTSNLTSPEDIKIAARLWLHHFHNRDKDLLHQALEACFRKYDWPPSVKEFGEQLDALKTQHDSLALAHRPRLTHKGLSPVGKAALAKLKSLRKQQ